MYSLCYLIASFVVRKCYVPPEFTGRLDTKKKKGIKQENKKQKLAKKIGEF